MLLVIESLAQDDLQKAIQFTHSLGDLTSPVNRPHTNADAIAVLLNAHDDDDDTLDELISAFELLGPRSGHCVPSWRALELRARRDPEGAMEIALKRWRHQCPPPYSQLGSVWSTQNLEKAVRLRARPTARQNP